MPRSSGRGKGEAGGGVLRTPKRRSPPRSAEWRARLDTLERQVNGEAEVSVLATREAQFRARIAELQAKLDTLRLTFLDTHPDIVQLKHQIQDLRAEAVAQRERGDSARPSARVEGDERVVNNPVYQQLRRELSQSRLTIDTLKARLAEARRLVQEEINRGKNQ